MVMAISVSSYVIILPDSRQIVMENAQPGECVDNLLIINSSPINVAMIECYEDIETMLLDDGGPAYTTRLMELKTNEGSLAGVPISIDGSSVLDHETCVMITSYIMKYESCRAEEAIGEHSVTIGGDNNEEEEEVVCVICQQEFRMGEMCAALECKHEYHKECIEKWLQKKNDCPICRAEVFPFLSKICMFSAGS